MAAGGAASGPYPSRSEPPQDGWLAGSRADQAGPQAETIPTIILTTSQAEKDLIRSYQLQANCYLRKPEEWDGFESLMRSTFEFWLKTIKLPLREPDTASFASAGHGRAKPTAAAARSERIAQATERESK